MLPALKTHKNITLAEENLPLVKKVTGRIKGSTIKTSSRFGLSIPTQKSASSEAIAQI
jgi:hypothetical protein